MKPTPKALTHSLPLVSTSRFAHLCRSRPRGFIREQAGPIPVQLDSFTSAHSAFGLPIYVAPLPTGSIQRVCHDTLDFVSVPGFPSAIETRSLPTLTRSYPRRFTFYVAWPAAPFATLTHSRRNVVPTLVVAYLFDS
jgi:hypothetical protein